MLKAITYLIVTLSISLSVCGQRYPFYNLNVEKGLIQSQATSLVQDNAGHLWIGTLGGLSRYDGKNFSSYTVRNGMLTNTVTALAIDKMGNLWIGSPKGISKYDGKQFKHYVFQSPEQPNINAVSEITISGNDVWCVANNKLYSINRDVIKQTQLPDTGAKITTALHANKEIWAATNKGIIYHLKNNVWDSLLFNEPQIPFKPFVLSMYLDNKKRCWIGTNAGLYTISNNKIVVAKTKGQPLYGIPPVLSIAEDKQGSTWLGTSLGAYRINDSSVAYCSKKNGLTDNAINQLITDIEGNIWMASDGQGVFRFSGAKFSVLDETSGLPSAQIMSIAATGQKVYLGSFDAGLYVFENGKVDKVPIPLKPMSTITAIHISNPNEIWLGTRDRGLWKYNGAIFKAYNSPKLQSNLITCLYEDADKRLWVGFDNGAAYYQHDTFHKITLNTAVQHIIGIGNDSILLATGQGLQLYNAGDVTKLKTNAAPDSSTPQCLALRGNELWIGTSDNGVICYNLKNHKTYVLNKSNGLQSDFIYNITTDNDDNIWVGTGYGIHKIVAKGGKPIISFYGKELGIAGMESNHNAVYKSPDGSIWFGTTNGAIHYNPKSKTFNTQSQPISIVLQSIKLFGDNIGDTTYFDSLGAWYKVPYQLHLPYKKNNITFTFQAITLCGTEQLKYRYRIDGLETKWSDWSNINTVTYSALPPGKYTLIVECTTGDSISSHSLQYPFEIITPFHKTGWFRLAILATCILLGITIQYIVNKRKQNRLDLMERLRREEQNKIRQRTAEDFHDEVGNKLTRINVLTNVLKNKIGELTPDTKRILEQIQDNTGQLYSGTRDILWSLKPANDGLSEILFRLRDFGGELFQDTEIDFIFTGNDEKWKDYKLPLDNSRNLIMIFKEALNNCLKYADATRVELKAELRNDDVLHLELKDNGKGFDIETIKRGHGIDNMNVRAKRLNGKLYIDSNSGNGTMISLSFRLKK